MKIVEPKVELWMPQNNVQHVARCARVCYGKDSGNDDRLYNDLANKGHLSMYRHETHYYIVPKYTDTHYVFKDIEANSFSNIGCNIESNNKYIYVVTNGQFEIELKNILTAYELNLFEVSYETFKSTCPYDYMYRYTFCITTQISTSRELNRVSPNNIAEQSTRYVELNGEIVRPHWMTINDDGSITSNKYSKKAIDNYLNGCDIGFKEYKNAIDNGMLREDARGILPLDTATKVVYTYNIAEWKHILDLRLYNKTGRAHGNAVIIAQMIKDELNKLGYEL